MCYSEIKSLEKLKDHITIKQYGRGCFIKRTPCDEDIRAAETGLEELKKV
ncbi:hypothetical protein ES703_75816 [subsurface metagenome]